MYKWYYQTPDGFSDILMTSDGEYLTGLWFEKHIEEGQEIELPVFKETEKWLDCYFRGEIPDFVPKYKINNATLFRKEVIEIMKSIPYGQTITYGDIAKQIAKKNGIKRMSAQAVGGAVGWNPISIIIPCHRVMGANGKIIGYGGGISNKIALLELEKHGIT